MKLSDFKKFCCYVVILAFSISTIPNVSNSCEKCPARNIRPLIDFCLQTGILIPTLSNASSPDYTISPHIRSFMEEDPEFQMLFNSFQSDLIQTNTTTTSDSPFNEGKVKAWFDRLIDWISPRRALKWLHKLDISEETALSLADAVGLHVETLTEEDVNKRIEDEDKNGETHHVWKKIKKYLPELILIAVVMILTVLFIIAFIFGAFFIVEMPVVVTWLLCILLISVIVVQTSLDIYIFCKAIKDIS